MSAKVRTAVPWRCSIRAKLLFRVGNSRLVLFVVLCLVLGSNALPTTNKYKEKEKLDVNTITFGKVHSHKDSQCHQELDILWERQLSTSILSTPIINDWDGDGVKEIIVTTHESVDIIAANTATSSEGWPFGFSHATFVADPVLFDFDRDGSDDIIVSSLNGEIAFLHRDGTYFQNMSLRVPPIRMRKDWFDGLDQTGADVYASLSELKLKEDQEEESPGETPKAAAQRTAARTRQIRSAKKPIPAPRVPLRSIINRFEGWLDDTQLGNIEHNEAVVDVAEAQAKHIHEDSEVFASQQWTRYIEHHPEYNEPMSNGFIFVDAHILATPVITDVRGDRVGDKFHLLIVPVSYYFDEEARRNPARKHMFPPDVDLGKYMACGLVAFDLRTGHIKWSLCSPTALTAFYLDASLDNSEAKAVIYSSPTLTDLEDDGTLELVQSTGVGYTYVITSLGKIHPTVQPMMTDTVYAPVVATDLTGDGQIDFLIVDANGNVVCFDEKGTEIWEQRISGVTHQSPLVADVDSDGVVDLVIATDTGHVWVVQADNGKVKPNFPVDVGGSILTQPILLPAPGPEASVLRGTLPARKGNSIFVGSTDGHVYIISGTGACVESIDIGEAITGGVLADDVTGSGESKFEIVVVTENGSVVCIGTEVEHNPAWTFTGKNRDARLAISRATAGVAVRVLPTGHERNGRREVSGRSFQLTVEIADNRPAAKTKIGEYHLKISVGRTQLAFLTVQGGKHTLTVPAPTLILDTSLRVEVMPIGSHGASVFVHVPFSFNSSIGITLEWMALLPFFGMLVLLLLMKDMKSSWLPT